MSLQSTPNYRISQQPLRALALLFLMLCLLISCPLKRELRSVFTPGTSTESLASGPQLPKLSNRNLTPAGWELPCNKTVQSILDEVETSSLFQHFDFKRPVLFLALSLAALYLLAVASSANAPLYNAFSGGVLTAKVPLFLRHRQLVI
jgi:hypothetical protein